MDLIIGGASQGKLARAFDRFGLCQDDVCSGETCPLTHPPTARILDRLHVLARRLMLAGQEPALFIGAFLAARPDAVILCDEIGCGIVPMGEEPRAWREETGRLLCALARDADTVERVYCGIAESIKNNCK